MTMDSMVNMCVILIPKGRLMVTHAKGCLLDTP